MNLRKKARLTATWSLLALGTWVMGGCAIGMIVGGMAESAHRAGHHTVYADYEGLKGKSFAVVVATDRVTESEYPGLAARLMERINGMVAQAQAELPDGATAAPRVDRLLRVLYNNPQWVALPREDVAKMLGVERLIVVDVSNYRLHEPGNAHVWDGLAAATVSVYEADGTIPGEAMYEKGISVTFPDGSGYLTTDLPFEVVNTELSNRLANRCAWLFFDHEEPNEMHY